MAIDRRPDAHNTPDLTAGGAQAVQDGADVRRVTAGYDSGDQRRPRTKRVSPDDGSPAVEDDGTVDLDTGLDFGAFGGRDVGTDIGSDVVSDTD